MASPYFTVAARAALAVTTVVALRSAESNLFADGQFARLLGTRTYEWNSGSGAADNGTTVIKPDDVAGNGRWLEVAGGGGGGIDAQSLRAVNLDAATVGAPSNGAGIFYDGVDYKAALVANANVSASAAIAGTKISPAFGNQQISNNGFSVTSTGLVSAGASIIANRTTADGLGAIFGTHKDRAGAVVQSGDVLQEIYAEARDSGATNTTVFRVITDVTGVVGIGDVPTRVRFQVGNATANLRTAIELLYSGEVGVTQLSIGDRYVRHTSSDNSGLGATGGFLSRHTRAADSNGALMGFEKSRGAPVDATQAVLNGDTIGLLTWLAWDGAAFIPGAAVATVAIADVTSTLAWGELQALVTNAAGSLVSPMQWRPAETRFTSPIHSPGSGDQSIQKNGLDVYGLHYQVADGLNAWLFAVPSNWQGASGCLWLDQTAATSPPAASNAGGAFVWATANREMTTHRALATEYLAAGTGTLAASGVVRLPHATAINWRNSGNTADFGIDFGISTANSLTFNSSGTLFFFAGGASRLEVLGGSITPRVNQIQWGAAGAPDLNVFTNVSGTGTLFTIRSQDISGTATVVGGKMFQRGGDCTATGAVTSQTGGDYETRAGDVAGSSGTRIGGNWIARAGAGATANGFLELRDGSGNARFRCDNTGVAFNGVGTSARPDYTVTNPSTDRAFDVSTVALAELAAVVGTVITDLITVGIFQ